MPVVPFRDRRDLVGVSELAVWSRRAVNGTERALNAMMHDDGPDGQDDADAYPLDVAVRRADDVVILAVTGDVDSLTAPAMGDAITDVPDGAAHLVLDLTAVSFLSSAGLSVFVEQRERLHGKGCTLSVVAADYSTVRPMQITALDRVIPLFPTVDDALEAIKDDQVRL